MMGRTNAPQWLFDINEYVDVLVFQVTARESNRVYSREQSQNPASLSLGQLQRRSQSLLVLLRTYLGRVGDEHGGRGTERGLLKRPQSGGGPIGHRGPPQKKRKELKQGS